ncbi:MAG: hypothetical protein DRP82_00150 [Planctomycetota bacterium]|nr:MAG: hypothetical protein DRP82_00150 [Planctomycetota bacterium]
MGSALRVATAADTVYIRVEGEGTANVCPTLRAFLMRMVTAGKRAFVVDLLKCRYVDSSFMGTLLEVVTEHRRRVVIINASENVASRFELLGLVQFMPIKKGNVSIPNTISVHRLPIRSTDKRTLTEVVERAHKQLIKADKRNRERFEPLLKLLRKELEQKP